jgi:hypothetical protein
MMRAVMTATYTVVTMTETGPLVKPIGFESFIAAKHALRALWYMGYCIVVAAMKLEHLDARGEQERGGKSFSVVSPCGSQPLDR